MAFNINAFNCWNQLWDVTWWLSSCVVVDRINCLQTYPGKRDAVWLARCQCRRNNRSHLLFVAVAAVACPEIMMTSASSSYLLGEIQWPPDGSQRPAACKSGKYCFNTAVNFGPYGMLTESILTWMKKGLEKKGDLAKNVFWVSVMPMWQRSDSLCIQLCSSSLIPSKQ